MSLNSSQLVDALVNPVPDTAWQALLYAQGALRRTNFDPVTDRILAAITLPKPLQPNEITLLEKAFINIGDAEIKGRHLLAVYDFHDPKPRGLRVFAGKLNTVFKEAVEQGEIYNIGLYGVPRDNDVAAYKLETHMVREHAPHLMQRTERAELEKLIKQIAEEYDIPAPRLIVTDRATLNQRDEFGAVAGLYSTFKGTSRITLADDLFGKYTLIDDQRVYLEGQSEQGLSIKNTLHEMAHAITDHYHTEAPAHGQLFLQNLIQLYDTYGGIPAAQFRHNAIKANMLVSQYLPPALTAFGTR